MSEQEQYIDNLRRTVADLRTENLRLRLIERRARDRVDPLCTCDGCGACAARDILGEVES